MPKPNLCLSKIPKQRFCQGVWIILTSTVPTLPVSFPSLWCLRHSFISLRDSKPIQGTLQHRNGHFILKMQTFSPCIFRKFFNILRYYGDYKVKHFWFSKFYGWIWIGLVRPARNIFRKGLIGLFRGFVGLWRINLKLLSVKSCLLGGRILAISLIVYELRCKYIGQKVVFYFHLWK